MKLARLDIQQLPGIRPGFVLDDLAPGINLVTGPNAIGKSSLIRALRYLVTEPAGDAPAALSLAADFEHGGHWSVTRTGRALEWRHDGRLAEPPPLPDRDALHCYWLTMENLVRAGDDDQRLVEQLRQALAGGYDLAALRSEPFALRPGIGHKQAGELRQAMQNRREVEGDYRELQRQEARLPELGDQIEKARQASSRSQNMSQALALYEIIAERRGLETALDQFPPGMDCLRGNELERLEELEHAHNASREQRDGARRSREGAQTRLERTGLSAAWPEPHELQAHRKTLDEAQHKQERVAEKREELDQARAREGEAMQALGSEQPPKLQPAEIKRAEEFAGRLKSKELEYRETETRAKDTNEAPDENLVDVHMQAVQALMAWLAGGHDVDKYRYVGPVVSGLGGLLAVVVGIVVQIWLAVVGGLVAVAGALWPLLRRPEDRQEKARAEFEDLNLTGPSVWDPERVAKRRDALQEELDRMRWARRRALAAAEDRLRLERIGDELTELDQERQALARELAFDPALTAAGIHQFAMQVTEYQAAHAKRCELDATIARLESDHAAVDTALADLAQRAETARLAAQDASDEDKDIERIDGELDGHNQRIEKLYKEAGLSHGERRALEDRLGRLQEWQVRQEQLRARKTREADGRALLEATPELITLAENGEREEREQRKQAADVQAEQLEALREQRSKLAARVENAGHDRKLEHAVAAVDQARTALEDRMDGRLFAEAGQFLLDDVEAEHRTEHEPAVLQDARERFGRYTHHAWDIELGESGFLARNLKQDTLHELAALSSGTRMQLLLAVRLAWTQRLEKSRVPLPLFLDEALTTADETRFAAIARSLTDSAREEGRQVFYLSARHQEVALWQRLTGEQPHCVDLAAIRNGRKTARAEDYEVLVQEPLPEPGGCSPEAYAAELGVPTVDPAQPAGDLHLFHVLRDDLGLLYRLMQSWNIVTLGQLEAILDSTVAAKAIPEPTKRRVLRDRVCAGRAWVDAWRQGRGRPVDRPVLEQSGAVSDKFIAEVTELAAQAQGNAATIVEALENKEVSGFRRKNVDRLRDYFEREGYLSSEQPLAGDERERQALFRAGPNAAPDEIRLVVGWLESTPELTGVVASSAPS